MSASNGSNPRLDRIEKLIEQGELRNQKAHARFEKGQTRLDGNLTRLEGNLTRLEGNLTRLEGNVTRLEGNMKRWAALGVQEARAQRRRSAELDKKIGQLAAAQLITEEKMQELKVAHALTEEALKKFITSMLGPRNGH